MEQILNFTNIDDEDFVGMYHGEEIFIKEGETKVLTERTANHIAGQLATKMLIRNKTVRNYLTDAKREPLIKSMIGGEAVPSEVEPSGKKEGSAPVKPVEVEKEFEDLKKKPKKKAKK